MKASDIPSAELSAEVAGRIASLRTRFDVVDSWIKIAERVYPLWRPRSADDLLCEDDFDKTGRLPYWPEIWPSSRVLSARMAASSGAGKRMLELGSGLGLISLVAAQAGYDVLATDYYAECLEFLEVNALRSNLIVPRTRVVDWRNYPDDLGQYDLIVAADVLYERPMCGLIAKALRKSLAPTGLALVSDPGRQHARVFPEVVQSEGLRLERLEEVAYHHENVRQTIRIYHVRQMAE